MEPKLCVTLAWPWWHPKGLWVPGHLPQPPESIIWGSPSFPHCCVSVWGQDVSALGTVVSLRPQQTGWGPGTLHAVTPLGTSPERVKALKNRQNSQSHGSKLAPFHPISCPAPGPHQGCSSIPPHHLMLSPIPKIFFSALILFSMLSNPSKTIKSVWENPGSIRAVAGLTN